MSEWITDRDPNSNDTQIGYVWVQGHDDKDPYICHFSNVCGRPWVPIHEPEPYQPPQPDTSLAASIKREGERIPKHGMACPELANNPSVCEYCDRRRILEAARKWDAMANQGKCVQGFTTKDTDHDGGKYVYPGTDPAVDRCVPSANSGVQNIGEVRNQRDGLRSDDKEGPDRTQKRSTGVGEVHEHALDTDPDGVGEGWRLLRKGEKVQPGDQRRNEDQWVDVGSMCNTRQWEETKYRRRIDADSGDKQEPVVMDDIRVYVRGKLRGRYANVKVMKHHISGLIEELDAANDALETQRAINDEREAWVEQLVWLCKVLEPENTSFTIEQIKQHLAKRGE